MQTRQFWHFAHEHRDNLLEKQIKKLGGSLKCEPPTYSGAQESVWLWHLGRWGGGRGGCEDGAGVIDTEVSSRVSWQRKWRAKVGNEEGEEEEVQRESGKKSSPEPQGEKVLKSYHWTCHRPQRMRKTIYGKYRLEFMPGLFGQVFKMSALGRARWRGSQVKCHEMKASRETQWLPEVKQLLKFMIQPQTN